MMQRTTMNTNRFMHYTKTGSNRLANLPETEERWGGWKDKGILCKILS